MTIDNQKTIMKYAEEFGRDNIVVVLGATDIEGLEISAETLTTGDPSFAGPLAGVQLGLHVYHILEPVVKAVLPQDLYEEKLAMVEMIVDGEEIQKSLEKIRQEADAIRNNG